MEVSIEDCLPAMGRTMTLLSETAPRVVFYRQRWLWDLGFWFFTRPTVSREFSQRVLTRFGGPGLLRLIDRYEPDVIVSVYPNVTEVLGRLKRKGRLRYPLVAAITDLAAMHYWASRGIDVHLVTHPESIPEVRAIVGASRSRALRPRLHRPRVPHVAHGDRGAQGARPAADRQDRARLGWRLGRRRRPRRRHAGAHRAGRDAHRLPVRPQRRAARRSRRAVRRASRACASRDSPSRCPTGSPPPTRSCTRPAASPCSRR